MMEYTLMTVIIVTSSTGSSSYLEITWISSTPVHYLIEDLRLMPVAIVGVSVLYCENHVKITVQNDSYTN